MQAYLGINYPCSPDALLGNQVHARLVDRGVHSVAQQLAVRRCPPYQLLPTEVLNRIVAALQGWPRLRHATNNKPHVKDKAPQLLVHDQWIPAHAHC
jgi:hypothetical protein